MPPGGRFNMESFLAYAIDRLLAKACSEGRKNHALQLNIHLNNCRIHSSNASTQFGWKLCHYGSSFAMRSNRVSRPKCSIFSAELNYARQLHALHSVITVNQPSPFRNRKGLMENEICSIIGRKNTIKIYALRPDDWLALHRRFLP
jgi:hypothetical protein